jgi:predicted nucleic acid-binding Zn ribbon protein
MPTYVYKFIDSGETIEVQQAFTDDPFTELAHPVDGVVKPVKKVFTPVGVSFKGGGFYKTDSRSGSSTSSASSTATKPADTAAPAAAAATTPAAPAAPAASPSPAATT